MAALTQHMDFAEEKKPHWNTSECYVSLTVETDLFMITYNYTN